MTINILSEMDCLFILGYILTISLALGTILGIFLRAVYPYRDVMK